MTKRTDKVMTKQYTARVHRQHTSLVIIFPKKLAEDMQVAKGDILLFEHEPGDVAAIIGKMKLRGCESGEDTSS